MDEEYKIVFEDKREEAARKHVEQGLSSYDKQRMGDSKYRRLGFSLQAPDQEIVGGVFGELYWDWLYISLLWVKEDLRGRNYGQRLMMRVEDEARQHGATNVYLDTFSFQAPDFYKQLGYQVFGELADFPPGHNRYFLTKQL